MEFAVQMLVTLFLFLFLGIWLDNTTGKAPMFTLIGLLVGIIMSLGVMYKQALIRQEKQKQQDEQSQQQKEEEDTP
jgi:F0F1-type ATP synthase assembly protein I